MSEFFSNLKTKLRQWSHSKTIWWNTVGMPTTLAFMDMAYTNLPLIRENMGASYGIAAFILIMVPNFIRARTYKALSAK